MSNPTNGTAQAATDTTVSAFTTTLVVNFIIGGLYYLGYYLASRLKFNSDVYYKNVGTKITPWQGIVNPDCFQNWDGASTVYVTRTMCGFFLVVGMIGAVTLVPIYSQGTSPNAVGMVTLTIGNLDVDSKAVWASWTVSIVFTVLTVVAAWILMNISDELFRKILASKHMAYRTMLCCRMPEELKASQVEAVFKELSAHYVAMAMVVDNFEVVDKVTKFRNDLEHLATKLIVGRMGRNGQYEALAKRPQKTLWYHKFESADQLTYDAKKLAKHSLPPTVEKTVYAANVLYETPLAASIAATVALRPNTFKRYRFVNVRHDVIWANTGINYYAMLIRRLITQSIITVVTLLWGALSLFIASIASIPTLTTVLPFLNPVLNASPVVKGLLTGFLPPFIVQLVFSLIPVIFGLLLNIEGHPLRSRIQVQLYVRYFSFVVLNILLVSSVGGSIFTTINAIVNNPPSIVSTLSATIPKVSTFFIDYVLLLAFLEPAGYLLNIGGLIVAKVLPLFTHPSPRDLEERSKPDIFAPSVFFANHALVAVIGITFMVIAPLVAVFCCIYFAIYTAVHAYKFVHVFRKPPPATEVGYKMLNIFASQLFVGLYIHQVTLIGLFSLRGQAGVPLLILEVMVLFNTALIHSTLQKLFPSRHSNPLSMFSSHITSITADNLNSTTKNGSPTMVAPEIHTASSIETLPAADTISKAGEKTIDMPCESPMSADELKDLTNVERGIHFWLAQPSANATVWLPDDTAVSNRGRDVAQELRKLGLEVKQDENLAYVENGKVRVREPASAIFEDDDGF